MKNGMKYLTLFLILILTLILHRRHLSDANWRRRRTARRHSSGTVEGGPRGRGGDHIYEFSQADGSQALRFPEVVAEVFECLGSELGEKVGKGPSEGEEGPSDHRGRTRDGNGGGGGGCVCEGWERTQFFPASYVSFDHFSRTPSERATSLILPFGHFSTHAVRDITVPSPSI